MSFMSKLGAAAVKSASKKRLAKKPMSRALRKLNEFRHGVSPYVWPLPRMNTYGPDSGVNEFPEFPEWVRAALVAIAESAGGVALYDKMKKK